MKQHNHSCFGQATRRRKTAYSQIVANVTRGTSVRTGKPYTPAQLDKFENDMKILESRIDNKLAR